MNTSIKELYKATYTLFEQKREYVLKDKDNIKFKVLIERINNNEGHNIKIKITRSDIYRLIKDEFRKQKLAPELISALVDDLEHISLNFTRKEWVESGHYNIIAKSTDNVLHYKYVYQLNLDHTDLMKIHNIVNLKFNEQSIKNHITISPVNNISSEKYSRLGYQVFVFIRNLLIDFLISIIHQHIV